MKYLFLILLLWAVPAGAMTFAVIGDYGVGRQDVTDVANLVKSWNPDFILTVGDNNYPKGAAQTIDRNVGYDYHAFIAPYRGAYGPGAETNRFFPSLGNHDWSLGTVKAYTDYFTLPGNERYYDFVRGSVHFFALDSDQRDPDGAFADSIQGRWFYKQISASTATFQVVYFHHSPYSSSGKHGSVAYMQWPFKAWGADAVLTGHDHLYERIINPSDGLLYIVNGLGGARTYPFKNTPIPGSLKRYNADLGALRVTVVNREMTFDFFTRKGHHIDHCRLKAR